MLARVRMAMLDVVRRRPQTKFAECQRAFQPTPLRISIEFWRALAIDGTHICPDEISE
jgi:hypothetical protein